MARIVIEVDELTGKKWKCASPQIRQKLSKEFGQIMKATLSKSEDDFWPFLEEVRKRAESKGFDDEILNQILSEE